MTAEDFFRKLIMLPSPSWHEEEAAAYIRKAMEGYGYFLKEDGHGNMLFYRSTEGEKLMFAAHMDTVDKAVSPAAVETEDCFMTDGTTALGADDKCAVAAMLASAAAGPDVLFLFTVAEERGLEGSAMISREFLQPFRIAATFIFDIEGEVGRAASSAPGKAYIHLSFHGKSAHAGFEPEKGRSALLAAAAAALAIPSGRIDADTTANIGSIRSGGSINVVPDLAEMEAEARSSSMEKQAIGRPLYLLSCDTSTSPEIHDTAFGLPDAETRGAIGSGGFNPLSERKSIPFLPSSVTGSASRSLG